MIIFTNIFIYISIVVAVPLLLNIVYSAIFQVKCFVVTRVVGNLLNLKTHEQDKLHSKHYKYLCKLIILWIITASISLFILLILLSVFSVLFIIHYAKIIDLIMTQSSTRNMMVFIVTFLLLAFTAVFIALLIFFTKTYREFKARQTKPYIEQCTNIDRIDYEQEDLILNKVTIRNLFAIEAVGKNTIIRSNSKIKHIVRNSRINEYLRCKKYEEFEIKLYLILFGLSEHYNLKTHEFLTEQELLNTYAARKKLFIMLNSNTKH
ncbi:hypothetical protein E1I18_01580 [Mycoplasmopsis mucosicanis]|uniref:Transmembrane protein n=1 Tax=Mycoplasmopsis mucosicanis TaxID=458208 RepID=A0A507SI74_9BACT|nr:hypothetical protein [Mycoplasmopsis mucosicanis]TQC51579.1 hypothetical protein E1I18_01580 [Mycoplasmopsis mucosicanis]